MKKLLQARGGALMACLPLLATAQTATTETPKAAPQLTYRSAFADYKPYKDAPLADWRELNATVAGAPGGAGDHAGHSMAGMQGMEMPSAPASAASAPMKKPMNAMPPMHDGHPKKGGQS